MTKTTYFSLLISAILLVAFACSEDLSRTSIEQSRTITLRVQMTSNATRISMEQEEGTKNLLTKWHEGDELSLVFRQEGKNYNGETVKIKDISPDGRGAVISTNLPAMVLYEKPYSIIGFTGIKGEVDNNGMASALVEIHRQSMDNSNIPMFFKVDVTDGILPTASVLHFCTYEVLHITNKSASEITFEHWGFNTELPWYQGIARVYFENGKGVSNPNGEWDTDSNSEAVVIPSGATASILSWYMPSGYPMKNAQLVATINGKDYYSTNTKSSDVEFLSNNAYHMYATWDGKKLMFEKDGDLVNELGFEPSKVEVVEDGGYGYADTGREYYYTFESTNPSVATARINEELLTPNVEICGHNIGNAIITITDSETGKKSQIDVTVKEKMIYAAFPKIGMTDEVYIKRLSDNSEAYSEDESIATCTISGKKVIVSGVNYGNTIIHVSDKTTGKQYTIEVYVEKNSGKTIDDIGVVIDDIIGDNL